MARYHQLKFPSRLLFDCVGVFMFTEYQNMQQPSW